MNAGLTWDVATSLPADRIQQARDMIADYLTILHRPSPVREIIAAVVHDLEDARLWRLANMAAEDAAIRVREAEVSHAEDVDGAIDIVQALAAYAGPRWRLSFPETYARVASLVWTDILTADVLGDRDALARALDRHYPAPACNRGEVTAGREGCDLAARSNHAEVTRWPARFDGGQRPGLPDSRRVNGCPNATTTVDSFESRGLPDRQAGAVIVARHHVDCTRGLKGLPTRRTAGA